MERGNEIMAIRTVTFNATSSGITPTTPQAAGVVGEHCATEVVINLSQDLVSTSWKYRFEYVDGANQFDTTDNFTLLSGQAWAKTFIPSGWTTSGGIGTIRLVISQLSQDGTEEVLLYTFEGRLSFANRNSGSGEREIKRGLTTLIEDTSAAKTSAMTAATEASTAASRASQATSESTAATASAVTATNNANTATAAANTAANSANDAALSANSAANSANTAANSVDEAKNNATAATIAANNAATSATNAANAANAATTNANNATSSANAAASSANGAASAANTAAIDANKVAIKLPDINSAISNANTAASSANTAASSANAEASKATSAAASANNAATSANTAKAEANTATNSANSAALSANTAADRANTVAAFAPRNYAPRLAGTARGETIVTLTDAAKNAEFTAVTIQGKTIEIGTGNKSPDNPYTLSGVNPTKVTVCENNIFDIEGMLKSNNVPFTVNNGEYSFSAAPALFQGGFDCTNITVNDIYTLSFDVKVGTLENFRMGFIYDDGTVGETATSSSTTYAHFFIQSNGKKIKRIRLNWTTSGSVCLKNVQLTKSSTELPYKPYTGTTYPINLNAPPYSLPDGTKDTCDAVSGAEIINTFEFPIIGNENWVVDTSAEKTNTCVFYLSVSNIKPAVSNDEVSMHCTHFDCYSRNTLSNSDANMIALSTGGTIWIRINKTIANDVTAFKSWLTNANVKIRAKKLNPTIIQHTPVNITQQYLINNIVADGAGISVDYSKDIATDSARYFPATNLPTNGDFASGAIGWSGSGGNVSASANTLTFLGTASGGSARQFVNVIAGHKYYTSVCIKSNSNLACAAFYDGSVLTRTPYHTGNGTYQRLSLVAASTISSAGGLLQCIRDERMSGWDNVNAQYVVCIDLTAAFGAGNEPTAAQMDAMMARFSNGWFDGMANLFDAGYTLKRLNTLDNAKADKVQENWITPTLVNGWVAVDTARTPKYRKDNFGKVCLKGMAANGVVGQTIFTLPTGYRPLQNMVVSSVSANAHIALNVFSSGIVAYYGGSNSSASLENVSFYTD